MRIFLVLIILCTNLQIAHGGNLKKISVKLNYHIYSGKLKLGEGTDTFKKENNQYEIVSTTKPSGVASIFAKKILKQSIGKISSSRLIPDKFQETGRKRGSRLAVFDWKKKELRLKHGDKPETMVSLPDGTVDQASMLYTFAFKDKIDDQYFIYVTDGKRLKRYQLQKTGEIMLDTKLGRTKTLHMKKITNLDGDRGLEFWLSIEHYFLPVKIRYIDKKGRHFDSLIYSIEIHPGLI